MTEQGCKTFGCAFHCRHRVLAFATCWRPPQSQGGDEASRHIATMEGTGTVGARWSPESGELGRFSEKTGCGLGPLSFSLNQDPGEVGPDLPLFTYLCLCRNVL